jgi:hypothetical protein
MITALKQLAWNVAGTYGILDLVLTIEPITPITTSTTDDLRKFAIATAGSVIVQIVTTLIKHGKEKVRQRRERRSSRSV